MCLVFALPSLITPELFCNFEALSPAHTRRSILNLTVQTHRLLLDAQEHPLGAAVHAGRPLPVRLAVLLQQTAALSAAEGYRADQLGPVQVTVQAPLYHIGDVQLADGRSTTQPARGEHPASSPAAKTF